MSFFDTGSIWESGLLFSQSKVTQILEGNPTPSLEELLLEDDFIQETQSQSHLLMNFLQSGQTMHRLLYYLTVPQLVENEERAYRFPYMSCEALCCNVQPLTDAITSRTAIGKDHLSMLFGGLCNYPGKDGMSKLQAKARRRYRELLTNPTEQAILEKFEEKIENGSSNVNINLKFRPLKPYLAGYIVKVITMLCKRSPAAIVRFLDSTPHILKGLVQHLENSSVTLLLPILFNLPFDRSISSLIENDDDKYQGNGMRRLCLSRFDNPNIENIPSLLLGTISDALDLGFRYAESVTMRRSNLTLSSVPHTSATACANAADVIVTLVKTAASSTPHKKFSQEGYNSEHRFGTDVNKGGGIQGVVSSDDETTRYDDDDDDDPSLSGPLSLVNAELDMAYHTPLSNDSPDSTSLRFLKSLRDGRHATSVQTIAFRSARLLTLLQASSAKGRLGLASGAVDEALGPIQTICESAFRVLSVILDACAKSCIQQQVFKNTSISTPPRILTLLCTNVEESIQGQGQDSTTVSSSSSSSSFSSTSSSTSTISELVKFLNVLSSCALDASIVASNKSSRSGPVPPSYENAPKLGSAGLALARALGNFVRCGSWLEVNSSIAKCLVFPCLLDTLQAFPWHSLLHRSVTDAIIDSLRHSRRNFKTNNTGTIMPNHQQQLSAAISSLFFEGKLLTRIVAILKQCRLPATITPLFRSSLVSSIPTSLSSVRFNDITSTTPSSESTTPISPPPLSRSTASSGFSTNAELGAAKEFVGYVGHFLLIANTIVSLHTADDDNDGILNTLSSNILAKHSDFWALVHLELAVANVTRGVLNGGLAPDTKASGHVGANADATGSRPSTSSSTNSMSLASENTSDEQVDDEDALLHKINRPHGDIDDDDEDENNNEEEELERERERKERVRSIERARQIVQLAMSDDDDNDDEEERNTNEGSRKQQEDDFDFDIPQSQSSINTVWNVESQGNDFSAFSAFNDEGDEEETTSTGTGKDTSEDWTFSFATSSPAAAAPISATLISESESAVTAGTLSTSPKGLMSISSPTMSFSNEIEQVVASTTNSPKTLTDMSSQKVVTSTFLEEDVFGQLDDEFLTTSSILPTNTTVSISTTSVASEKATTATTSIDDDVFGGGGQIEDDPFGGSTSSFSSITSSIQTTTGGNNVVDDPFAF